MDDRKDWYITIPFGTRYHIFTGEHRSLYGGAMMLAVNKERCEPFKGTETWQKGEDCKACFKKAGLIKEPDKETGK